MFKKIGLIAVSALVIGMPLLASAATLTRQLEVGMSGADVSALQTFLAKDATLYPQGLVTGYFGPLTKAAVANFQSRNGIAAVGRVGPATLPVLNLQIAQGMNTDVNAPLITSVTTNVSTSTATVIWNTNESARGVVYYSSSPLVTQEHLNSVDVSGNIATNDGNSRTSQNVMISGLQPNTTYYYMVYTTDVAGNVSVTWPTTFRTAN